MHVCIDGAVGSAVSGDDIVLLHCAVVDDLEPSAGPPRGACCRYAALADACGGGAGVAESARAGGCRQLLYSVGFLLGFALGPYVPGAWQLAALGALLLAAAACTRGGVVAGQR